MKLIINLFLLSAALNFFEILPQFKYVAVQNYPSSINIKIKFLSEPYSLIHSDGKLAVEYKGFMNEGAPGSPALPKKIIYVAIPPRSNINVKMLKQEVVILKNTEVILNVKSEINKDSVVVYKKSLPDLKYFAHDVYPSSEIQLLGYTWIRNYYCAAVQINTHSYNWKKKEIKEIIEAELQISILDERPFSVNYGQDREFEEVLKKIIINYDHATSFRSFPDYAIELDSSGNWIDYSQEYVKLGIPEDGIYRITYDDLTNFGVNPSQINPSLLKIFNKGKQIPLFISEAGDLSFDQNDYIEFFCRKNYGSPEYRNVVSLGEDYLNFMDRYNDTSFIWLCWEGTAGLRADSINSFNPEISDTIKSYIVKLHLEKDERLWYYDAVVPRVQLPFWQENKVWTWLFVGGGSTSSFSFNTTDFVPNTPVKTCTRLISNAADIVNDAHSSGSSLNSTSPADTIFFDFRETVNLLSSFNSNSLIEGNNLYRLFCFPTSASFHQVLIDWVDIDFYRWNTAQNDSLLIIIPDSVSTSVRAIRISNISSDSNVILYKFAPQIKKVTAYSYSSGNLAFTDTVDGGDAYLIINAKQVKSPKFLKRKQFKNLRDAQLAAEYIIISNKELEESVVEYKNFIASSYPVRTELVFIDDIYDEYSFGYNNAEAVRQFLISANTYWQNPKPSYLNIIGDANYDYKKVITPLSGKIRKNLVPAFGNPVSDSWFTAWDTLSVNIPQMYVGRIPASNNNEVYFYLQKHQAYLNRAFDDWNKHYLFFSGGDVNDSLQLEQIKHVNQNLLDNVVKPAPVGGIGIHFYKTIRPVTNLGPYSQSEVKNAIGNGGLFISYIGHSGTQTWDNGITSASDLKNNFSDRNPLITDFGCSTGKFAEPDIDAFGELFILGSPDGQAINYCGNSSWGYLSTSLRFPDIFYRNLLLDTILNVGKAHLLGKIRQFNESGYSDVNRAFNYCNILFGDPIIEFKTPVKPNFTVSESSFEILGPNPSDQSDSAFVKIKIYNFGRVVGDSLDIYISDSWQNLNFELNKKIPIPLFLDSLTVPIPVRGKVGEHRMTVELDKTGLYDELYETDNIAEFRFTVYSTSVRPVEYEKFYSSLDRHIRLLNPTLFFPGMPEQILFTVSSDPEFTSTQNFITPFDTVYTEIEIDSLIPSARYWWRAKLNNPGSEWSEVYSFRNQENNFGWFADFSYDKGIENQNTAFDSSSNSWKLSSSINSLVIHSAGSDDGEYASVLFNGAETLPNTFFWGIGTAEVDTLTLKPENFKYFLYSNNSTSDDSLIYYLNSLPEGKIVVMTLCADAAQSVLGFSKGTDVRRAIETFGSLYVDSVGYRDSWCIIGRKGAAAGSVPEAYSKRGFGEANLSLTKQVNFSKGKVVFPKITNSAAWINLTKNDSLPPGSSIEYFPIGYSLSGETDTLPNLIFSGNNASLLDINPRNYPELKIGARLNSNEQFESPSVFSVGVNFNGVPELSLNYQIVSIDDDSVDQGRNVNLSFYVYNAGETSADSFYVLVEIIKPDNSRNAIFQEKIISLSPDERKIFNVSYNTSSEGGANSFYISVDNNNQVKELYEDNNFYSIPFYTFADTTKPSISITFDGSEIFDGEYVSSNPNIKIELSDPSDLPITDTSSVSLFLNDRPVYFADNIESMSYQFNAVNPKVVVEYTPELPGGEYILKVIGKDAEGNLADSSGIEKRFLISNEVKIIDAYNYPNPFSNQTYFTFKLTQIPDELKIKIYTVAGRLVREIEKRSNELEYDFNKLFWDGKDQDGDFLANGVYFYKIILKKGTKIENLTRKIAIIR
jgi:hypothetical protein